MVGRKLDPFLALVWKNFRVRWKNRAGWITDIIMPSLVCALCLSVFTLDKPRIIPNCNLKAKALPTAGGMLFLQTFFCSAINQCEDEEKASFESFKPSLLSNLVESIKEAFHVKLKRSNQLDLKNLPRDFYVIDSITESIDVENKKWQLLYNTLLRSDIYSVNSENENSNIQKLLRIKKNFHTTGVLNSYIRALTEEENFKSGMENFLNFFFCGPNMQNIEEQFIKITSNL